MAVRVVAVTEQGQDVKLPLGPVLIVPLLVIEIPEKMRERVFRLMADVEQRRQNGRVRVEIFEVEEERSYDSMFAVPVATKVEGRQERSRPALGPFGDVEQRREPQ